MSNTYQPRSLGLNLNATPIYLCIRLSSQRYYLWHKGGSFLMTQIAGNFTVPILVARDSLIWWPYSNSLCLLNTDLSSSRTSSDTLVFEQHPILFCIFKQFRMMWEKFFSLFSRAPTILTSLHTEVQSTTSIQLRLYHAKFSAIVSFDPAKAWQWSGSQL